MKANLTSLKAAYALAFVALAFPALATTPDILSVPNDGTGCQSPSVSANGNLIAYLTDVSNGAAVVKLYNRTTGTTVSCSTGVTYCARPRVSRDGNFVAFFGTPNYAANGSLILVPMVYTVSTGTLVNGIQPVAANSTTLWDASNPKYGFMPGISDSNGGAWTVSFADLLGRAASEDGGPVEYVCTSSTANGSPTHLVERDGGVVQDTDISSGGTVVYVWNGEVYVGTSATARTSTGGKCNYPSIDSAGDKVAYESDATDGTLSGANVYVIGATSGSPVCPYSLASGGGNSGGATHPFISPDGNTVAFNCSSSHLSFAYSCSNAGYAYAAQCATSGGQATVLSANYSTTNPDGSYSVYSASNACAFNLSTSTSLIVAGAFDSTSTGFGTLQSGGYGSGSNVFEVY